MEACRILGCLKGIATGDAIGKQTETLSREDVLHWYPHGIRGFEGTPGSVIPRYLGNAKHEWRIGETTDDTERTVAVARAILTDRTVSHASVGRELLRCTKCVHPGLKSLWEFHQAADPGRIARNHDGCGAAIRVAPVGIFYASHRAEQLLNGAREASVSTHGGSLAIAAAAAVAAAVSAAIDEASPDEVLERAECAAAEAERRWPGAAAPAFADAVRTVHHTLRRLSALRAAEIATVCFRSDPRGHVPDDGRSRLVRGCGGGQRPQPGGTRQRPRSVATLTAPVLEGRGGATPRLRPSWLAGATLRAMPRPCRGCCTPWCSALALARRPCDSRGVDFLGLGVGGRTLPLPIASA